MTGAPLSDGKHMPLPYKFSAAVAKYRGLPRTRENVLAHAEAITREVLAKQRAALARLVPTASCPCASGTWHTEGKPLLKALKAQTDDACRNGLAESHRARTDRQVAIAYKAALEGRDVPLVHHIYTGEVRR